MNLKDSSQFDFLDALAIISFCVGLQNLELNISQENLDNQTQELDARLRKVVDDIHNHFVDIALVRHLKISHVGHNSILLGDFPAWVGGMGCGRVEIEFGRFLGIITAENYISVAAANV